MGLDSYIFKTTRQNAHKKIDEILAAKQKRMEKAYHINGFEFLIGEDVIAGFLHKSCGIKGLYIYKFFRMFLYGAVSVIPAFAL